MVDGSLLRRRLKLKKKTVENERNAKIMGSGFRNLFLALPVCITQEAQDAFLSFSSLFSI